MLKKRFILIKKKLTDPNFVYSLPDKIIHALLLIREDFWKKELTTWFIAKKIHITEGHLCNLFHDSLGIHCIEYLHCYRIDKSKPLLRNRTLSIKEVALRVGFKNQKYYSRIFYKIEGKTPTEYRRRF